ncbi:hypothetical protein AKO1_003960, partial [Acrasis kona]
MLFSKFEVSDTHYKKKAPELYLSKERRGLREKFDELYNKLDKVLLISILMPKRSRDVQFDKTALTEKEFYMEITQQKLHYLFKDPVVVSTLEQVLGKKDDVYINTHLFPNDEFDKMMLEEGEEFITSEDGEQQAIKKRRVSAHSFAPISEQQVGGSISGVTITIKNGE